MSLGSSIGGQELGVMRKHIGDAALPPGIHRDTGY